MMLIFVNGLNYYFVYTQLIVAIFASKTQFSSTKPQPLIPGGTIKDTNDIKQFLENHVDSSLSMIKLIKVHSYIQYIHC